MTARAPRPIIAEMKDPDKIAVVGCGLVGASWAALFLAHGRDVVAADPAPGAEERLRAFAERARPDLAALGLTGQGALTFVASAQEAVACADFVQESAVEDEAFKRALLASLDAAAPDHAIISSSTSALSRSRIVADCVRPERVIVGHPFNPPHLLPLVEVLGQDDEVVARACAFYRRMGRRPIVLRKEAPGHIANRLTAALYREAVHLVAEGVADVADIDAAISEGPGLRWAIMGPHLTYHLGGGAGGIRNYLDHLGPSQERRWASLGAPALTEEVKAAIVAGVEAETTGAPIATLEARRDRLLIDILRAKRKADGAG